MPDMLVKLYNLPLDFDSISQVAENGVVIRKPIGPEKHIIIDWIREHFGERWASEFDVTMGHPPFTSFVAIRDGELLGFSCYDATGLGLFGPTGVREDQRGKGIGKALLLAALMDMKLKGYAYAIIGSVGPAEFYEKVCGATIIPDSTPSIWANPIKRNK